jgi:beta-glucuronidase
MEAENFVENIHLRNYMDKYKAKVITADSLILDGGRRTQSLNGEWHFIEDQYDTAIRSQWFKEQTHDKDGNPLPCDFDPEIWPLVQVPAVWNLTDPRRYFYEGHAVYFRTFDYEGDRDLAYICLEGVNYQAVVFLNGEYLGMHEGGSTPFCLDATGAIREKGNRLFVCVDNTRTAQRVPMDNTDWFNWGGIYRDVFIMSLPRTFIQSWSLGLCDDEAISCRVRIHGLARQLTIRIDELGINEQVPLHDEEAVIMLKPRNLVRWSPENPKLYDVHIMTEEDEIFDKIGFRTIESKNGEILLNGKPIWLRGISVHEDHISLGKATDQKTIRQAIKDLRDLNGNYLRLAHYPHSRLFSRIADEMGVLLWEEIPVYWAIAFNNKSTYLDAENQLKELILRDANRASVIIWSVGNENDDTDDRYNFMSSLAHKAKELDPCRCVSAACLVNTAKLCIADRLEEDLDIIGVNEYYGWYDRDIQKIQAILENSKLAKPVIITEVGCGARAGNHGSSDQMWTEEFQADFYRKQLKILSSCPSIKGMTPWILYDFHCPRRLNRYQEGFNRKGLIDCDRVTHKLAFKVLSDFYKSH